jgi:hypothetical protein
LIAGLSVGVAGSIWYLQVNKEPIIEDQQDWASRCQVTRSALETSNIDFRRLYRRKLSVEDIQNHGVTTTLSYPMSDVSMRIRRLLPTKIPQTF